MHSIRAASLCFVVALTTFAPLSAQAQGSASSLAARMEALEARVAKLEGNNLTAADLVGTYRAAGFITDLDAPPASVTIISLSATVTLAAGGMGTIVQQGGGINLTEVPGLPWTSGAFGFPPQQIAINWSYSGGILHITDGTPNLDVNFNVGAGGRVLTFAGLSDDNTADLIIATRLQ